MCAAGGFPACGGAGPGRNMEDAANQFFPGAGGQLSAGTFNTYKFLSMTPFFGEMVGTGLLVFVGQAVVSNVVLAKTKGHNSGWIVISFGWAMAVFIGVFVSASASKAHLNPAVTIAFAVLNKIPFSLVPIYLAAQFLGAMIGSTAAWVCYRGHFGPTQDANLKLAVFCTAPAIRNYVDNVVTETLATFTLVFGALF